MATPPQVPHDAATSKAQAFHVQNKVAIVTGAGSGINLSFATLLLHRGCSVLIADLSLRPEAQALIARHASPAGGGAPRAVFVQTDVTQWPQLERMFAVAMREFGGVDIVCPGAGVYDPYWSNFWHPPVSSSSSAPLKKSESTDAPTANRYASLDINLTHPIRTTQLALAAFLNPPPGREKPGPANPKRVVLVGSIAGQIANLNTPIYVAAKHGITGFIRSLAALEPALGIRVNGVAPGVIKTPLWTEHPEKMGFLDEAQDVWATPEEVAEAMVRCLEDEDLGGGTILEVGAQQTRKVEALNDPGPSGRGHTVSKLTEGYREVFEWLGTEGWGVGGQ